MIEIKGLCKTYKNLTAVNGLNLTIDEGDIFGFIGPNGAGKTTTIKMLATLIKPTSGSAEIAGYSILTQPDDVKRVIGYMPDFFGVYDDMKVWEYLDFFAAAYKIEKARRAQIIDDVLNLTDLGFEDILVETVDITNRNTAVEDFARVIESWEGYVTGELSTATHQPKEMVERLRSGLRDHVYTITSRRGFATWPLYVASGRKPRASGRGAARKAASG